MKKSRMTRSLAGILSVVMVLTAVVSHMAFNVEAADPMYSKNTDQAFYTVSLEGLQLNTEQGETKKNVELGVVDGVGEDEQGVRDELMNDAERIASMYGFRFSLNGQVERVVEEETDSEGISQQPEVRDVNFEPTYTAVDIELRLHGVDFSDQEVKIVRIDNGSTRVLTEAEEYEASGENMIKIMQKGDNAGDAFDAKYVVVTVNREEPTEQENSAPDENEDNAKAASSDVGLQDDPQSRELSMGQPSAIAASGISLYNVEVGNDNQQLETYKEASSENPKGEGPFSITLEAYAKGEVETAALDVVLVLDQSISMQGAGISALRTAAGKFIEGAADSGGDIRISIVGFGYGDYANNTNDYLATEIYNGATAKQYRKYENTSRQTTYPAQPEDFANSWKSVSNTSDRSALDSSLRNLKTSGATNSDAGLMMATLALDARTTEAKQNRKPIVIMFTDGIPTYRSGNWDFNVANQAIANANQLKGPSYNAEVYTVGVMSTANPGVGIGSWLGTSNTSSVNEGRYLNRYMHFVSSNYLNPAGLSQSPNPTPSGDGYYKGASGFDDLSGFFDEILQEITTSLGEGTVLKDTITPYFKLPNWDSDDVVLYTSNYGGLDDEGKEIWSNPTEITGTDREKYTISINEDDRTISVSGFDYAKEYVSDNGKLNDGTIGPRGSKLIVVINIEREDSFIGGNTVETNVVANIYDPKDPGNTNQNFEEEPDVDVKLLYDFPIQDDGIYVGDSWSEIEALFTEKDGTNIKIPYRTSANGTTYYLGDPDDEGYTSNEYAKVVYTVTKEDGTEVGTYTVEVGASSGEWDDAGKAYSQMLLEDTVYKVTATVTPSTSKTDGVETPLVVGPEPKEGTVYIFVPTVDVTDTIILLNEETNLDDRIGKNVTWKCENSIGQAGKDSYRSLSEDEPELIYAYDFVAGTDNEGASVYKPQVDSDFVVKSVTRKYADPERTLDITNHVVSITNTDPIDCSDYDCISNESDEKHDFTVHVIPGKYSFTKHDDDGNVLANVEFGIYKDKASAINGATPLEEATSDQVNGTVTFEGLGIGTYYIVETVAVAGFEKTSNIWVLTIGKDGDASLTFTYAIAEYTSLNPETAATGDDKLGSGAADSYVIKNKRVTGTYEFDKTSSNSLITGENLNGAEFTAEVQGRSDLTLTAVSGGTGNGKVVFSGIKYGYTYVVTETKALEDHLLSDVTWILTVDASGTATMYAKGDEDKTEVKTVVNQYKTGDLIIKKSINKFEAIDGDAVFTFKIEELVPIADSEGEYDVINILYRSIVFDNENVLNQQITIEGVTHGHYYRVTELDTLRYQMVSGDTLAKQLTGTQLEFSFTNNKSYENFFGHADFVNNQFSIDADGNVTVQRVWTTDVPVVETR